VNDSRPWWLWPNLLSLDAPAVAVTWQVFLASVAGVAVPLAACVVLALVVWAVYLADRGLDARRGADGSDRHRTAGRNLIAWTAASVAALVSAAAVAFVALPRTYLNTGFVVAAVALAYFVAVHGAANRLLGRGTKEAAVGVVFAAGTALPLVAEAAPCALWLAGVIAFAALCWLNCALISMWEDGCERGPPLWVVAVAGSGAVVAALDAPAPVVFAVSVSVAALVVLHSFRTRVSIRAARVLADVVLLSPLLVAVWL
jgi:hypothetical protein